MSYNKKSDDVVIVAAVRTPITKAYKGEMKDITNDLLVYFVVKGLLEKTGINPELVDEVIFGNGLSPMNGTTPLRVGVLRAEIPLTTPISTVNRQCASGLESLNAVANKIKLNQIEIGIAGGFESMTSYSIDSGRMSKLENDSDKVQECFIPMGETAEILAEKYCITREEADKYAYKSQARAFEATKNGLFKEEIVTIKYKDQVIDKDDGIRVGDVKKLSTLKSVFRENGICTAGNSSQLSDGAAAVLLMTRKKALELGMTVLGSFIDYVCIGTNPSVMGQGPIPAVQKLLVRNNLTISDINYFEINEAFACQALHCIRQLGIDEEKANLQGGAIALGHPIGCTGARIVCTLFNTMKNNNFNGYGICSLCVGTGQGVAALLRRE